MNVPSTPHPMSRRLVTTSALAILLAMGAGLNCTATTHFDQRRAAVAAYQARDFAAMARACENALALRPDSPRYLLMLATARTLLGDQTAALAALDRLADLGISLPVEQVADLAALRDIPEFTVICTRLAANRAAQGNVAVMHELPDTAGILEGLAWRPATGDIFLGDVHARCVWRLTPDGSRARFADAPELLGVFGLAVDEPRGALWLALAAVPEMRGYAEADKGRAALAEVDLATGALRRLYPAPADGRDHVLGDLALAPDGSIYLTDSAAPIVWRLARGADALEVACESPAFASLQGLGFVAGGTALIVADYANGLHVIDLATSAVRSLPPPPRATLLGIDGFIVRQDALIAVQNGISPQRVVQIELTTDASAIAACQVLASGLPRMEDLTLPAWIDGHLAFIAGAGWDAFAGAKSPPPPRAARILRLGLAPAEPAARP